MTKFVGLSGKIGTGKTTICKMIQQELAIDGKLAVIVPFGLGLKEHTANTFGVPFEWFFSEEGKNREVTLTQKSYPVYTTHAGTIDDFSYLHEIHHTVTPHIPDNKITVRKLLQWWATNVCRALDPDFWVKHWEKKVQEVLSLHDADVVLCDDIRFPENELPIFVDKYNGSVYRIMPYEGWNKYSNHYSETALDGWGWGCRCLMPDFGAPFLRDAASRIIHAEKLLED